MFLSDPAAAPASRSRERFSELIHQDGEQLNVAEAALLIACEEYPELDVDRYLRRLDEMGDELRRRLPEGAGGESAAQAINSYLFEEEGFHGNQRQYHDPRNSFLNDVLDRRTGIPITLSTVYMEVARRVGFDVHGVGLPGHFIVALRSEDERLLLDPFHGGALLTERACQERLDRLYGGRIRLQAQMLASVDPKHMLARMLRNLKVLHMKALDHTRALQMVDLLLRLNPYSGEDLRDRGLIYAAVDCYGAAADDLEAYLSLVPAAPEAEALAAKVVELRHRSARLN